MAVLWTRPGLERLSELLQLENEPGGRRSFGTYRVIGRRGVGKTELLAALAQRSSSSSGTPFVICRLPEPAGG